MPSLKLSNPFRLGADRPSLKKRAASLRATAARVMSRNPDADLLVLGARWRAADAAYKAALSLAYETAASVSIDPPAAVFVQPGDHELGIARFANSYRGNEGVWYSVAAEPFSPYAPPSFSAAFHKPMTRLVEIMKPRSASSPAIPIPQFEKHPWPEAQARADEICAAYAKWKAENEAALRAAGVPELEAETDAFSAEAARLEDEISAATAKTIEGLKLQAEIALQCQYHADGEDRAWAVIHALLTVA